jgi:hypothetical protein
MDKPEEVKDYKVKIFFIDKWVSRFQKKYILIFRGGVTAICHGNERMIM